MKTFVAYAWARRILSPVAVVMLSRHETQAVAPCTSTETSETSIRMKVVLRKICSQLARMFSHPARRFQFGWTQIALESVAQNWMGKNPDAARAAIQGSSLSAELKTKLLKTY